MLIGAASIIIATITPETVLHMPAAQRMALRSSAFVELSFSIVPDLSRFPQRDPDARWISVANDDAGAVFMIDRHSMIKANGLVNAWIRREQLNSERTPLSITFVTFRCSDRHYRINKVKIYWNGVDPGGFAENKSPSFQPVLPESPIEGAFELACA